MNETRKNSMHTPEDEAQTPDSVPAADSTFEPSHEADAMPQEPPVKAAAFTARPSEEKMHIERLEKELEKTKDQMLRAMADTENMRRRAAREREDAGKYAVTGFARDLLSVADNLRRAIEAVPADVLESDERIKSLFSGVEATERDLLSIFDRNGIKKLEPMHEPFDPNIHEVMFEAPIQGFPPGTICQLIQPGYTLHERLLRPARVGVVKDSGGSQDSGQDIPPEPGQNIDTQV